MKSTTNQNVDPQSPRLMEIGPSRTTIFLVLFGLATVFGTIQALQTQAANSGQSSWRSSHAWGLLIWYLFLPVIVVGAKLGRKFPITASLWLRNIWIHLAMALLLGAIHPFALVLAYSVVLHPRWFDAVAKSLLPYLHFWYFQDLLTTAAIYGVSILASQVWYQYRNHREAEVRTAQLETRLANANLAVLKMQLHPHFLFNALHSISSLQMTDVEAAQKMMALLGDFLRMTLRHVDQQQVALCRELEMLRCYLAIEHMRFGERLRFQIDAQPDVLDAAVPQLVLQPIVENSVRHGIAPFGGGGEVLVRALRDGGRLRLEIQDSGPGIPPDRIGANPPGGLGLTNTRARLEQLYGADHEFLLENVPKGGLRVTIVIPYHRESSGSLEKRDEVKSYTHADRR